MLLSLWKDGLSRAELNLLLLLNPNAALMPASDGKHWLEQSSTACTSDGGRRGFLCLWLLSGFGLFCWAGCGRAVGGGRCLLLLPSAAPLHTGSGHCALQHCQANSFFISTQTRVACYFPSRLWGTRACESRLG